MKFDLFVDPDIQKAETLPGWFYSNPEIFSSLKEKVFAKSWQWIGHESHFENVYPFQLLDGFMDEPMVLTKTTNGDLHCLSNVCTHRGNLVVHHPGKVNALICMYHGRRFDLNGYFKKMPEFEETQNFPRPCDNLHQFPIHKWGPLLFTGIFPSFNFEKILSVINERIGFLPLDQFKHEPTLSKDYLINCHWALYCDNYLEGFHIPFVHQDLNATLDYGKYTTLLYPHFNLQIGYAQSGEESFTLPPGHIDFSQQIGAYYYWIFPNMMFNFYPWGLSVNIVKPINEQKTKVSFITYVYDETKLHTGAGALLDKVEREDEFVVENVHKGLKSRVYSTGRFSPTREMGTHHFHRLLVDFLNA